MYNPQKPVKVGVRINDIADAWTGYILAIVPYFGMATTATLPYPDMAWTTRIIVVLVDIILRATQSTGYHVFTDRLYTSVALAKILLLKKVHLTGTMNVARRGAPQQVKKKNLRLMSNQKVSYIKANRYHVLSWRDKRNITCLSTLYGNDTAPNVHKQGGEAI